MSISKNIKEWYSSIESHQFEGIAKAVKEILPNANPKYDQVIDGLIARVTNSYMNYHEANKDDRKMGLAIYELTCCLCDRFTESSNPPRLRSGIYHITRCLREVQLFLESKTICNYLIPGTIFSSDLQNYEYFFKLSLAWRQSAMSEIKCLSSKFNLKKYNVLLEMIKFDFQLLKYSEKEENYSTIVFARLQKYIDQLTISGKEWTNNKIIMFVNDITDHIKSLEKNSILNIDPLKVYNEIIEIMHSLSVRMIKENKIKEYWDFINECSKKFQVFLENNKDTQTYFQLHIHFYKTFLKPVSNFDNEMLNEISDYKCQFQRRLKTTGSLNILKANSMGISKILMPMFNYWLKCMNSCKTESLNEIFFEIVDFINHVAALLGTQPLKNCECNLTSCKAKYNTYEQISIMQKCGIFVGMLGMEYISKQLFNFSRDFINEIIMSIYQFKKTNCGLYSHLWTTCGQIMYNLSVLVSFNLLDESAEIMSNLCSFIIQEEGIKSTNNFLRNSNPLSTVLHKLSGVYFRSEKYREAMIVTALNGLLSYGEKDAKAFKMWANIKHKCKSEPKYEDVMKQTMIACLKADKAAIKELGVDIQLEDYDLIELYKQEIQGLQKAKVCLTVAIKESLKELNSLKKNTIEFVEGVQYLGYHMVYFRDDCGIIDYLKKAEYYLSTMDASSRYHSYLKINLRFFKFMEQCNVTSKKIKKDIQSAKDILQRNKNKTHDETIETEEVVPVYRTINMKHDAEVTSELDKVLLNYEKLFGKDPKAITNCWEPQITLDLVIIIGEVARLYLSQTCEKRAWLLAYQLASTLKNHAACLYVTARSISLRYIDDNWIEKAHEYAASLKTSENIDDKSAVGMFWTSLSDFYFEIGKVKDAVCLIDNVKDLKTITLASDVTVYLEFIDTIVRNYQFLPNINHEEYSEFIIHHLYSMVSVSGSLDTGGRKMYYGVNTLLDGVNNMSIVMNSIISFREISVHLTFRLELAQSLGATLRVAECLKSLCLIDISRLKLDDCEVKLQGIEQILDIEGFGLSMKTKCDDLHNARSNTILTSRHMDVDDPLRDVIQNEASPILKKKIFVPPEFMLHDKCECYRCQNIPYQYLVFSSTHIRAQMYALKKHSSIALQNFQGAFEVRTKALEKEEKNIQENSKKSKKQYSWKKYYTMVDFVLMLLDFSKFLMYLENDSREKDAMEIAFEAIKICKKYKLHFHPVFSAANELLFSFRLQKLDPSFKAFTVSDQADVDISDLVVDETSVKEDSKLKSCKTPSHSGDLPLRTLHRKKTPPLLPLRKVDMNLSDSEDEDAKPKKTRKQPARKRLIIVEEESSQSEDDSKTAVPQPVSKLSTKNSKSKTSSKSNTNSQTTKPPPIFVDKTVDITESLNKISISSTALSVRNVQRKKLSPRNKTSITAKDNSSKLGNESQTKKVTSIDKIEIIEKSLSQISIPSTSSSVENTQSKRLSTRSKTAPTLSVEISSQRRSRRLATREVKLDSQNLNSNSCSSPDLFPSDDEYYPKK